MKKFMSKLNRTYNGQLSFLPSKKLLINILRNDGVELPFFDQAQVTKEELISAIFNGGKNLIS